MQFLYERKECTTISFNKTFDGVWQSHLIISIDSFVQLQTEANVVLQHHLINCAFLMSRIVNLNPIT